MTISCNHLVFNRAPAAPAQAGKPVKRGRGRPKKVQPVVDPAPVVETAPETAVEAEKTAEAEAIANASVMIVSTPEVQAAEGAAAMEVVAPDSVANATNANAAAANANEGPEDDAETAALRGRVMDVVQAWRDTLTTKSQVNSTLGPSLSALPSSLDLSWTFE